MIQKDLLKDFDTTSFEQNINTLLKDIVEENKENSSFFQSLSAEEQNKLLTLERDIVMEYENPEHYQEGLNKIHVIFDSK